MGSIGKGLGNLMGVADAVGMQNKYTFRRDEHMMAMDQQLCDLIAIAENKKHGDEPAPYEIR